MLTQEDWLEWLAQYEIEAQEHALAEAKANAKAKAAQKRGR